MNEEEIKNNTIVFIFGRFQPFTVGHLSLLDKIIQYRENGYNNYYVGTSTVDEEKHLPLVKSRTLETLVSDHKRKNPLTTKQKVKYIKAAMKYRGLDSKRLFVSRNLLFGLRKIRKMADRLIILTDLEGIEQFNKLVSKDNKYKYFPDFVDYIAIGNQRERDYNNTNISGSLIRELAVNDNFEAFKQHVPYIAEDKQMKLFTHIRRAYMQMLRNRELMKGDVEESLVSSSTSTPSTFSISSKSMQKAPSLRRGEA